MRTNIETHDARLIERLTKELGDARYRLGKEEGRRESLMAAVAFLRDEVEHLKEKLEEREMLAKVPAAGSA